MNDEYKRLFDPIEIGSILLKNRFMMAPMEVGMAGEGGMISERLISFFKERAENDVALIISGSVGISPEGRGQLWQLSCYDDRFMPGFRDLAHTIHNVGCKLGAQIYHAGRQTIEEIIGVQPLAPSAIPCPFLKNNPREMNANDFDIILERFVNGANRLELAGLDLIEVHLAHGYLLHSFLSPFSNKRTDKYGGNLDNRMRYPREVIRSIIEAVNIPVTVRISAEEYIDEGLHVEEVEEICQVLESDGVEAISLSAGSYGSLPMVIQPMMIDRGFLVPFAERIKKRIKIPVIVAGRLNEPSLIKNIITANKADMVALGRTLIADAAFVRKIKEGRARFINRCIACNQGCIDNVFQGTHVTCTVNPRAGFELDVKLEKTSKKKLVMIVGAGPAGLAAAKTCAERGHDVILVEKNKRLGGKILIASSVPGKLEISLLAEDLIFQISKLENISVITEREVDTDFVLEKSPDVLVLAVGSRPILPAINGARHIRTFFAEEVIQDTTFVMKNVAVVGGGLVGVDTALELRHRGVSVKIIEILSEIAKDAGLTIKPLLLKEIEERGIEVYTQCEVRSITERGLIVVHKGIKKELETEAIVLSVGYESNNETVEKLSGVAPKTYVIGDALEVRNFLAAVTEGFRIGMKI